MKRVLVPIAPGFEEIEAVTIIDVLRRAGIEVVAAGTSAGPIEGSRGISVAVDELLENIDPERFDMIAIPGGSQGVENLKNHPPVAALLSQFKTQGKLLGAICAAPSLLSTMGLISGRQVTSHPSVKAQVAPSTVYSESRVVVDGKLVTSRGPGTAMEFSLKLVELLVGAEKVTELKAAMVV